MAVLSDMKARDTNDPSNATTDREVKVSEDSSESLATAPK
jgi:hypothetical protein